MKRFLIIIFCLISACMAYAQNDPASVQFIRSVVPDTNKVIYIDSVGNYAVKELQTVLDKDTLFDDSRGTHLVALILSQDEHTYIRQQLAGMAHFAWRRG